MAADRGHEFEIKIAKAKDLPLSWFDLVLRPEKFKQHIKTLEDNPNIEPTGLQLVATFLEKGGVLEGQTPLPAATDGSGNGGKETGVERAVVEERRQRLINCALFIGSFMQWDLALFEKSLPPAVSYSLLVQLTKHYPLTSAKTPPPPHTDSENEEEEEEEDEESRLLREPPPTVMAHVLFNHWVVRFLTLSHLPPDIHRSTNIWDITCATPDHIKSLLEPKLTECVGFLEEASRHCSSYRAPTVAVSLPVLGRKIQGQDDTVQLCLPSAGRDLPTSEVLSQIHYSLGCHYFWHNDFKRAHSHFKQCSHHLSHLSTCPSLVDQAQLKGFTSACVQIRQKRRVVGKSSERETERAEGVGEDEEDDDETGDEQGVKGGTLLERLEHCRISDIERVPDHLIKDLTSPSIPLSACTALHRELVCRAQDSSDEPVSKRAKLDPGLTSPGSSLPVHAKVAVCNAVRATLEGRPVQPPFWRLFLSPNADPSLCQFLFHVCGAAIDKKSQESKAKRLQMFVRSVCCKSAEPEKVWKILLSSPAKSLATQQDTKLMHSLFSSLSKPVECPIPEFSFSAATSNSVLHERKILSASNCQDLLTAVENCFKALPSSEHKALAQRWVGSGDEFMNFDPITDPLLLTKYNAMVQKAHQLKRAQCYTESVRFLRAALGLIPRPSGPKTSSSSHPKPDQAVLDLILWVELKGAVLETKHLPPHAVVKKFGGLIDKAKNFCQRSYTSHHDRADAMMVCLASAFLLNTHSYQHLASFDHPFTPGKVAPRVAMAALAMKEDRDARKSVRDLFSAVLSVFSTPVASGSESRSEIDHKQLQLRSQFDVLVENLEDPTSLSLLLVALVRIWSILKKPEEEIRLQTEHAMYWPTVIGSPGSVNADHVFRTLLTTLHHSLSAHPHNDSWMVLEAEVHYATEKYGAALLCYLRAGALTSKHFEDEVPPLVWPAQVYRKIINCCTQLNLHTHAVLFCQLLVPVDYELVFSLLSSHSSSMAESYFVYFWDMVIIEYLIYINAKRGDKYKQSIAMSELFLQTIYLQVQIAGQAELNCNNSPEVLARAAQVRRRKLLQSFYDQSFSTI